MTTRQNVATQTLGDPQAINSFFLFNEREFARFRYWIEVACRHDDQFGFSYEDGEITDSDGNKVGDLTWTEDQGAGTLNIYDDRLTEFLDVYNLRTHLEEGKIAMDIRKLVEADVDRTTSIMQVGDYISSSLPGAEAVKSKLMTMLKLRGITDVTFGDVYTALNILSDDDLDTLRADSFSSGMPQVGDVREKKLKSFLGKKKIKKEADSGVSVEFNGEIYTLTGNAEFTNRVINFGKNYNDASEGEEFDFEMSAPAVDRDGNEVVVYWIFSDIKGDERDLDDHDYDDVDRVVDESIRRPLIPNKETQAAMREARAMSLRRKKRVKKEDDIDSMEDALRTFASQLNEIDSSSGDTSEDGDEVRYVTSLYLGDEGDEVFASVNLSIEKERDLYRFAAWIESQDIALFDTMALVTGSGGGDSILVGEPGDILTQRFVDEANRGIDKFVKAVRDEDSVDESIKSEDDGVDEHMVREIVLQMENDGQLYRQRILPIIQNLAKKKDKGVYDEELAIKLWMYAVDDFARKYHREEGVRVPRAERIAIATELRDGFDEQVNDHTKAGIEAQKEWERKHLNKGVESVNKPKRRGFRS